MSDLKKTFIGGYKKSVVDETINTLNEKLEKANADEKQMLRKLEGSDLKIAELENQIEQLRLENERLAKANNQNQNVFNDIAKVYKRAYDAGYDIVCESKDTTVNFLNEINTRFDETMEDTETTLTRYESIQAEINAALSSLNDSIKAIAVGTSAVLDKAKTFSGLYGQMKDTMLSAVEDSKKALKAYEDYSSEFSAIHGAAENESLSPSEVPAVSQITAKVPDVPEVSAEVPDVPEVRVEVPEVPEVSAEVPKVPEVAAEVPKVPEVAAKVPEAPAGEFRQFGRKSRISAEDRSELIRKALMKNAGV